MTLLRRLDPWLAPLLLMAVIYYLSDQPGLSSGLGPIDTIGRKFVHAFEYALLCGLWWRALRTRLASGPALLAALAMSVGYAVTDEYHQTFVDGRDGLVLDVVIDALAAAVAALAIRLRITRRAPATQGWG